MGTAMQKTIAFVGMDLGTFKTSVASSAGIRDVLYSAVGWPRDHVARTMLGREVVFGQDIVEQRLALNIVRPFERGLLKFNDPAAARTSDADTAQRKEAARLLVQQAVSLARAPQGVPVYGVIGAPSRASVANKKVI